MLAYSAAFDNTRIKKKIMLKRTTLPLFSDLYKILDRPIAHLVLDECQFIKNWNTGRYKAIKALVFDKLIGLTNTPFANRWWDIYTFISLYKDQPFPTPEDFFRIFGDPYAARGDVLPSRAGRLVKFMMEFTIARPNTILGLPGLQKIRWPFALEETSATYTA